MQKYFDSITTEAGRLENDGFPFLATLLRNAVKRNDKDSVDGAVMRVVAILDNGKRYREAGKLRQIAANADRAVRAKLWS
jgi:hypothetical protein